MFKEMGTLSSLLLCPFSSAVSTQHGQRATPSQGTFQRVDIEHPVLLRNVLLYEIWRGGEVVSAGPTLIDCKEWSKSLFNL